MEMGLPVFWSKTNHVLTIHSDMQFYLSAFLENNIQKFKKAIQEDINIFPVRKGRKIIPLLRTLIVKIILSLNTNNI